MVIRKYHWVNSASRVLISTCSTPLVQNTTFHCLTLTSDLDLQSQASQGKGRPSCQKSRSKVKRFKQESAHRQTDTHTDATKRITSSATRSIKMPFTKTEIHNIFQYHQRKTEQRLQATYRKNLVKLEHIVPEITVKIDRHTHRQAHHNTVHHQQGSVTTDNEYGVILEHVTSLLR